TGAVSVLKGNVGNATFAGSIGDYGGVVEVSNNITWSNDMTLAGQGYNAYGGALRNISGNNTHTGTITAADVNTRITASGGTLFLNGNINLTTAGAYANFLQHAGGDIRLGGNITGSATSINVLGSSGGTNFLILDRAFAWGNSTGLSLGSGSSTNYGRVDLNGNDQTVTSLAAAGTVATQNLITNRSSTLASFTINNTSNFNATPSFSGNLVVVKNGGGQATMSTIGTHTGGWIINNGTVSTGSAQTFGTGNVTINSGGNATLGLNAGTSSYSNNFSITGSGSGNGALQTNTSGNYTISGPVALTGNAMIGSRAGSGSGSGMIFTGGISTGGANRTLTLNAFGGTSGNNTVNTNFISLNSTTNLGTGGTLTMGTGISAGGTGTFNINVGGNTWGTTIVQGRSTAGESSNATLNLGAANALGSSSSVLQLGNFNTALEGITVNLNGNNQTIGGLRSFGSTGSASANGTRTVTSASAATLTIDNSSDYLFDGAISGAISLTKNGTATQTLSGNNSYTGATTVNNGALVLSSANAVAGTSGITVANGGRINTSVITALNDKAVTISGNGIGTGAVSFNEGANRASNATFTLAGNATIRQSQYANLDLNNGIAESSAGSVLTLMGGTKPDASFNGSAIRLYGNNTFSGGLVIDSLKVVPTNSGWAGAGNGAAGVTLQNGGGLDLAFENRSIAGNLTMSDGFIYSSGAARTFQAANYLITGGGTVASNTSLIGSGALIKSGAATLTLSGSNSYGGATSVNQGVLSITNANALGSTAGGTTVSSNAALNLSGNITVTGEALSLSGGGI
ncbi:MAG: beta strand repeat-containing protein, partial [Verrucomicrobiota bacterium]